MSGLSAIEREGKWLAQQEQLFLLFTSSLYK